MASDGHAHRGHFVSIFLGSSSLLSRGMVQLFESGTGPRDESRSSALCLRHEVRLAFRLRREEWCCRRRELVMVWCFDSAKSCCRRWWWMAFILATCWSGRRFDSAPGVVEGDVGGWRLDSARVGLLYSPRGKRVIERTGCAFILCVSGQWSWSVEHRDIPKCLSRARSGCCLSIIAKPNNVVPARFWGVRLLSANGLSWIQRSSDRVMHHVLGMSSVLQPVKCSKRRTAYGK